MADETGTTKTSVLKTTPLTALNRELGGAMVDFAGYAMPVQFPSGIVAEHHQVREKAGLFDVSHMGPCFLQLSPDARRGLSSDEAHRAIAALFEPLVCGDIRGLAPGEMRYTLLLNEDGGVADDLMVARPYEAEGQGSLYIVVNAATKEADFARMAERCAGAELVRWDDRALLALQGPAARRVLAQACAPEAADMTFMTARLLHLACDDSAARIACMVTCSGYTGEDGYEILAPASSAEALARRLLAHPEVAPIGLGARDSLRLEAGLCLYGHDLDPSRTPVEGSLTWAVSKVRRERADFPGAARILDQIANGAALRRVGLRLLDKAPAREGADIAMRDGKIVGIVTSGGHGHTAGFPVAMGYVPRALAVVGTELDVIVRNKPRSAVVAPMPFVKHSYFRG